MNDREQQEYFYDQEPEKKDFRFWFLTGAVAVFSVILVVAVGLLISTNAKNQKYNSYIVAGNEYYSAGDYQNAIIEYQNALQVDEEKSSAYLNMSSAYIQLGDYISAAEILNQGLTMTDAEEIRTRLSELETLSNTQFKTAELLELSQDEIEAASEAVMIENALFDMIAAYSYTDYYRDFGAVNASVTEDGTVSYYYSDMSCYISYYNLENEKVLDSSGKEPIADARPCSVTFTDISRLFGSSEEIFAVSREKLEELFGSETDFYEDSDTYYMETEYKNCSLKIETDKDGNIVTKNAWNEVKPIFRKGNGEEEEAGGTVSGYVQNAVTGSGMTATLKLRQYGSRTGTVIAELRSGSDGSYSYSGEVGKYTAEVSAEGYITEYMDIEILKDQVRTGQNIVLSPTVGEGEIRIVLTWGASPADLDSHTNGTSSAGTGFHIYFANSNVAGIGVLDVDDINGYGPETTTISDVGGSFTFSVYDFTQSGNINTSGATVKVYLPGSTEAIVYTVPQGSGNTWTVFTYSNGNVTPVNTIN